MRVISVHDRIVFECLSDVWDLMKERTGNLNELEKLRAELITERSVKK